MYNPTQETIVKTLGQGQRLLDYAQLEGVSKKEAYAKGYSDSIFNQVMTKAQKFLAAKLVKVDPNTAVQIDQGNIQFGDANYYGRRIVSGSGGIIELLRTEDLKTIGVRNLNNAVLPERHNLALTHVGLGFGYTFAADPDPASTNPAEAQYFYNLPNSITSTSIGAPAGFLAAEYVLRIDNTEMFRWPVRRFFEEIGDGRKYIELQQPVFIKEKTLIQVNIEMPSGIVVGDPVSPSGQAGNFNSFAQFDLVGIQTQPRASR